MTNAIKPHMTLPNGDVLFEGDYAKRRDGITALVKCRYGWGATEAAWLVGNCFYYKDGTVDINGRNDHLLDLIAKADPPQVGGVTDSSGCVLCDLGVCDDTPKLWSDMTDAEKGSLLLAHHEGGVIECWEDDGDGWVEVRWPAWTEYLAYRKKLAEPKRETVILIGCPTMGFDHTGWGDDNTNRITLPLIDGKMPTGTFTNEDGETIVVEALE